MMNCQRSSLVVLFILLILAASIHADAQGLMEKGDSCRRAWQYNKALSYFQQAYDDPSVKDNPELQMQLLERIMRTHFVLRNWRALPEASYQLYHLAKKHDAPAYVSMALFMRGMRFYMVGQEDKGYQTCLDAVKQMKDCDYPGKYYELADYYSILARMYLSDKRFDEALRMSDEEGRYVKLAYKNQSNTERGMLRFYAIRLDVMANLGRFAEADSLYRLYGDAPITDPLCGDALLDYFRLSGNTDACLRFLDVAMRNISVDGDTIGRNMQRLITDMGDIYYQSGQYQKAAECYANMGKIADSLSVRGLRNVAEEVYKVIDNEHAIARHRQMLIITIAGILLLSVVILLLVRQSWLSHQKNRSMLNTIQQLMRYREQVIQNGDPVEMGENEQDGTSEDERQRFKEVDKRVMKELLFAQNDFGRDELMRLLGVDKNTLPSIIQRYAGTTVPGYVNNKRMEYAVSLIKEHPEYTLGAISEACGIKSPATFIRNFKSAYGMTPSEFRKQLEEDSPPHLLTFNNTPRA